MTDAECIKQLREHLRAAKALNFQPPHITAIERAIEVLEARKNNACITYVDAETFAWLMEDE